MTDRRRILLALLRRAAISFPWGVAGVYLIFLLGGLFIIPAPAGSSLPVVSAAMAERWGNPVTAALVQALWSGLLGAALGTAGVPFLLERRTALWSGLHLLLTAAVFSLVGWQCRWFRYCGTWLFLLGLLLLCYLLLWAVRYLGWRQDLLALRRAAGLVPDRAGRVPRYLLLAAGVELALPWLLRLADPRDVPVLTGICYPFLILPMFCFFSAASLGRRKPWYLALGYALLCAALTLPNVFLLYNYTALFQVWIAGIAALLGGGLGILRGRREKF